MVQAWAVAYDRLTLELDALVERIERALSNGEPITESWFWRRGRLEDLLIQAGRETAHFAQFAELSTLADKGKAVQFALDSSARYLALPRRVTSPAVILGFNRAPQEALEALVGTFQDGSPLSKLFQTFGPQQSALIQDALIKGIATGKNPRAVAREVRDVGGMPLNRALTISRTEPLRSYRSASITNYRANTDSIEGWVRIERLDLRTCPVCWGLHGQVYTLADEGPWHPNCRGTTAPIVIGIPHNVEPGAVQFAHLDEAGQLAVLGPKKFEAYREGRIRLEDLVAEVDHPHWGRSTRERGLDEALGRKKHAA